MKNKFLRVAAAMAVCALISVCAVSGTYAKYVSSGTGSDSARVAKWGFGTETSVTVDLFSDVYSNGSADTVKSADNSKVIAPGTSYSSTVVLKGAEKSEVAYTLDVAASAEGNYTDLDENANFVWTLKKAGAENESEFGTVAELLAAINQTTDYAPNADVPTVSMTIGWKWAYSADEAGDAADTALGVNATPDSVKITITITATQKD